MKITIYAIIVPITSKYHEKKKTFNPWKRGEDKISVKPRHTRQLLNPILLRRDLPLYTRLFVYTNLLVNSITPLVPMEQKYHIYIKNFYTKIKLGVGVISVERENIRRGNIIEKGQCL